MDVNDEILRSICSKGVQLRVHHGVLFWNDSKSLLTEPEVDLLNRRWEVIDLLLAQSRESSVGLDEFSGAGFKWLPLTLQQEFALSRHLDPFFGVFALRIRGRLDTEALQESLHALVERHEALRTKVAVANGELRQQVCDGGVFAAATIDCSNFVEVDVSDYLRLQCRKFLNTWLSDPGQTFSAALLKISHEDHALVIAWDHLFEDYASSVLLFGELWDFYRRRMNREYSDVAQLRKRYSEYTMWQRGVHPIWKQAHSDYWKEKLRLARPLSFDRCDVPPVGQSSGVASVEVMFGKYLSSELGGLAGKQQVPLAVVVVTLFCVALSRLYGQLEFIIPFVATGRYRPEHCEIVGYLPHVVILGIALQENSAFSELLRLVFEEVIAASEKSEIGVSPIESGSDVLKGPRFQWFQTNPDPNACAVPSVLVQSELGLSFEAFPVLSSDDYRGSTLQELALSFAFWSSEEGIHGVGSYRRSRFAPSTMDDFVDYLLLAAGRVIEEPNACVGLMRSW